MSYIDPSLRLVWFGVPWEDVPGGEEPETIELPEDNDGVFGVASLVPIRRIVGANGERRSLMPWLPNDCEWRGVRIFNKQGDTARDFDSLTLAPVLIRTISPQWNMSTADVYGTRFLDWLRGSPRTRAESLRRKRDALVDEGKAQQETVRGIAEEFGKALYKDLKSSNSATDRTITINERVAVDKKREARKALNRGLPEHHAARKGL